MRFTNGMAARPLSWPGSFPSCVPLRRLWLGLRSCPGAILWVVGLVSAGYFLGNIPIVKNNFSVVIYGIIIVSVLPVVIEFIRANIKK